MTCHRIHTFFLNKMFFVFQLFFSDLCFSEKKSLCNFFFFRRYSSQKMTFFKIAHPWNLITKFHLGKHCTELLPDNFSKNFMTLASNISFFLFLFFLSSSSFPPSFLSPSLPSSLFPSPPPFFLSLFLKDTSFLNSLACFPTSVFHFCS